MTTRHAVVLPAVATSLSQRGVDVDPVDRLAVSISKLSLSDARALAGRLGTLLPLTHQDILASALLLPAADASRGGAPDVTTLSEPPSQQPQPHRRRLGPTTATKAAPSGPGKSAVSPARSRGGGLPAVTQPKEPPKERAVIYMVALPLSGLRVMAGGRAWPHEFVAVEVGMARAVLAGAGGGQQQLSAMSACMTPAHWDLERYDYAFKWLTGRHDGVRVPRTHAELNVARTLRDQLTSAEFCTAVRQLQDPLLKADLGFAVGGVAGNWAAQQGAVCEAVGAVLPKAFLKRLAQRRAEVLPASLSTHAHVSYGKMKKVTYYITSRHLFETLQAQYLSGALHEGNLLAALAQCLDDALFELREGLGHTDLQITADVLDAAGAVVGSVPPTPLTLRHGPDVPPSYAQLHAERHPALPLGWDRATTRDGRLVYIDHRTQRTSWAPPPHQLPRPAAPVAAASANE